jgi:anthraniloyl-CoA monooxygenase
MNIVCIGGGPAGLYFALLMKQRNPGHQVVVIERNRPYDTFGWGVVFSDQTLGNLVNADETTARSILQSFNHWDDIDVNFKGHTVTSGGHGPQTAAQHPAGPLRSPGRATGVRD